MNKNAIIFRNGVMIEEENLRYYYNKKERRYIGVETSERNQDMFESWAEVNGNIDLPMGDVVIPLGEKCVTFNGEIPELFYKGVKQKIFSIDENTFKDHRGKIIFHKLFINEFNNEIKSIFFTDEYDESYLIIYKENINTDKYKYIKKFIKKHIIYIEDANTYLIEMPEYINSIDYTNYILRKDMCRNARKKLINLLIHCPKDSEKENELEEAFYKWLVLR